ncbi:MAG TPA: ROK family transcriptional regulator [Kofleriaceae bacterium]
MSLRPLTVDPSGMREHNLALLLNLVFKQEDLSRADLARVTGLSRSTVSAIIDVLIDARLVRETGSGDSRGGRRPTLLEFNADAYSLIGVELGATHLRAVATNLRAQVRAVREIRHAVVDDPSGTIAVLGDLIEGVVADAAIGSGDLLGIGLAAPCPLELRNPDSMCSQLMPAWQGVKLPRVLSDRFDCPVSMDNDANLGALAERWWGAGRTGEDLTYIKVATGVGAGHIISGDVYRGSNGTAGEIGHLAIDLRGPQCRCGLRGCLAALIGAGALADRTAVALSEGRTSTLTKRGGVEQLASAAIAGDALAREIVGEAGAYLGIAVASLLNLLNPAIVVLGGPLTAAGDILLDPIRATVRDRSLFRSVAEARIVTSELGDNAIAVGAATLVLQAALKSPSLFSSSSPLSHVG